MIGNTDIPFVAACSYPPRAGNAVRPLVDGVPAFRRIGERHGQFGRALPSYMKVIGFGPGI